MTTIRQGDRLPLESGNSRSFDQVLKQIRTLSSKPADSYRQARPEESPPRLEQYERIEAPGKVAADTVRYVTRDGEQVIVYRSSTPALYQHVAQDHYTLEAQANGYTLAVDNDDTLSYYEHITAVDTSNAENGVITYKFGANQWIVTQGNTPDTFERLLHMEKVLAHKNDGYALLGEKQTLPLSSVAYTRIDPLDNGLVLVETKDSQRYVVSEQLNPGAYKQVQYQIDVRAQIADGEQRGYSLATSLPADYDIDKLTVESIDEKTGLIHFQYDGQKYMLPPGDAAEAEVQPPEGVRIGLAGANDKSPSLDLRGTRLYELLGALKQTEGTIAHDALVNAIKNGDILASDSNEPVALADIDNVHVFSEGGVQVITLQDGSTVVAIEAMAPVSFKAYAQAGQTLEGITRAQSDGYRLADPDEYLPSTEDISAIGGVGEYGPGLIAFTYRKPGGEEQKIIVSEDLNAQMFDQVANHRADISLQINDLDALRAEHGLPPLAEVSLNDLPTTEKDEDGNPLSVQDLSMQRLIEQYRAGVKDGSIDVDDPRAKFLRALEAKSMAENGMSIIPEHGRGYKADASDPIDVTSRDVREEIFDVAAIDRTLSELLADETLQADMKAKYEEALDLVEGGAEKVEQTKNKLLESAFSEEFVTYIQKLQESGNDELAQQEILQTYASLADIDPAKADQFVQDMQIAAYTLEVEKLMQDPSLISDENTALATQDMAKEILKAIKAGGADIPRRSLQIFERFVADMARDGKLAADFGKVSSELGDIMQRNGAITTDDIDRVLDKSAVDAATKGTIREQLNFLNSSGLLGSFGGGVAGARAIYQLVKGDLADTTGERLGIAGDFFSFLGSGSHFMTLGGGIYDKLTGTESSKLFGLDKSVPDMWKPATPPPGIDDIPRSKDAIHLAFHDSLTDAMDEGKDLTKLQKSDFWQNLDIDDVQKGIEDGIKNRGTIGNATPSTFHRVAGSAIKVIGALSDVGGGVLGVVSGAFTIRDGVRENDPFKISAGALGIAGGVGSLFGAASSVASAIGYTSRMISGLGPVGFLVSGVLSFVSVILSTIKTHKLHKISMENWDQIKQFEKDGLLQENGASSYVWLQTYLANYRQRDAPENQSVFDFRSAEWLGEDGTHHDYIGDGPNEISEGFKYSTRERTFIDEDKNERQYTTYGYGTYRPADEQWPPVD